MDEQVKTTTTTRGTPVSILMQPATAQGRAAECFILKEYNSVIFDIHGSLLLKDETARVRGAMNCRGVVAKKLLPELNDLLLSRSE